MRGHRLGISACFVGVLLIAALGACERSDQIPEQSVQKETQPIPRPRLLPECTFADGLKEQHPEVSAFVNAFLQTCLNGDYSGYRRMVSRTKTPVDKERFQAIYYAIKSVSVDAIDPVAHEDLPETAYRVVSSVEFLPEKEIALRRGANQKIAILVFKEDGQWRMLPAPPKLQPRAPTPTTTSAPTTTRPTYPWEDDGDS